RDRVAQRRPARQEPEGIDAVRCGSVRGAVRDEPDSGRRALGADPPHRDELVDALEQREQRSRLLVDLGQEEPVHPCCACASSRASASATWHAARRPGPSSRNSGVTDSHSSIAYGQRARNRQPSLGLITFGGSPTSAASETPSGARGSGTAERSSCVYGCFGLCRTSSVGPSSTRWPAYMTSTRSAM